MASDVSLVAALAAGALSFLSPCVLPLVPPYLVYLSGTSLELAEGAEPRVSVRRDTGVAAYSIALGIPLLLAALAVEPFAAFLSRFRAHLATVEKAMGGLLVLTGIAFLTGFITQASYWLLEAFPVLGRIG